MELFLTYCSWQKDDSFKDSSKKVTPDILYTSPRIVQFIKKCKEERVNWAIFSDKYGIWFPNETHEWYDYPPENVTQSEFIQLAENAVKSLEKYTVFFFGDSEREDFPPLYSNLIKYVQDNKISVKIFSEISQIQELKKESNSLYAPHSAILFLTICSFNKSIEGFPYYEENNTIYHRFLSEYKEKLIQKRQLIYELLFDEKLVFDNKNLKEHDFNTSLVLGPDIGGDKKGYYLPAIWRYEGRFFSHLKINGKNSILKSNHHFLILSGLYGIVTPIDPLQLYSVPLYNNNPVQTIWRNNDFLTMLLFEYIKKEKIRKIFDFTGIFYYRDLINWQLIKGLITEHMIDCDILHAFSSQGAGDNALPFFGDCVSGSLIYKSETQLESITPEEEIGPVYFRTVYGARDNQPSDFPFKEERINVEKISDADAKKILISAENATFYSYQNPNNPPDAGSSLIWQYGKGLEKLLHCKITKIVGLKLQQKYSGILPDSVKCRPKVENKIWKPFWYANRENAKQITLGQWSRLNEDFDKYSMNPLVPLMIKTLNRHTSYHINDILSKCGKVERIRNEATHPKIISFEEGLIERRKIIPIINEIITLLEERND